MKILILDIDSSNTKKFIYQGFDDNVLCIEKDYCPTPEKLDDMLKTCIELVNDSPQVDCILTTSFSNSVVVETKEDSAILHYPTREGREDSQAPEYSKTGYSTLFPKISERLKDLDARANVKFKRRLSVSGYINAKLCYNNEFNKWDWTHASNSGNWDQEKQEWISQEYIRQIPKGTVSPAYIIGEYLKVPVMVGGHSSTFISANTKQAYISTGKYTTVSVPEDIFQPDDNDINDVRWLLDPAQNLHEQLIFETPLELDKDYFNRIAEFLEGYENNVVVAGPFAHNMAFQLSDIKSDAEMYTFEVRRNAQHEEAAKFALRHLSRASTK